MSETVPLLTDEPKTQTFEIGIGAAGASAEVPKAIIVSPGSEIFETTKVVREGAIGLMPDNPMKDGYVVEMHPVPLLFDHAQARDAQLVTNQLGAEVAAATHHDPKDFVPDILGRGSSEFSINPENPTGDEQHLPTKGLPPLPAGQKLPVKTAGGIANLRDKNSASQESDA
ncbi:MAG: hypothetical protein HOO67_02560 [Candidatus Peribacteraceae bacterium]|nr:hypothetical protein [Candidatus Peribacteraceae bacterium]